VQLKERISPHSVSPLSTPNTAPQGLLSLLEGGGQADKLGLVHEEWEEV
jgi:hypothetical protein